MPSNAQRRQAAKRKLERQLERRAQRARKRRQLTIGLSALGVVAVVAAGVGVWMLTRDDGADSTAASETTEPAPPEFGALPAARSEPLPES